MEISHSIVFISVSVFLIAFIFFCLASLIPGNQVVVISNKSRNRWALFWIFALIALIYGMVAGFLPPTSAPDGWGIWIIWTLSCVLVSSAMVWLYLGNRLPTGSILDAQAAILVRMFICHVELPSILQVDKESLIKIKFLEDWTHIVVPDVDRLHSPKSIMDVDRYLSSKIFEYGKYNEHAVVENEYLRGNPEIYIVLSGDAFEFGNREHLLKIEDVMKRPFSVLCLPKQTGAHSIVVDIFDNRRARCGGLVVPAQVGRHAPILRGGALRVLKVVAGALAIAAAIAQIISVVAPGIPLRALLGL